MARLITTKKEKETKSYLDWDNENIGKLCKTVSSILDDEIGERPVNLTSILVYLVADAVKMNGYYLNLHGVKDKNGDYGDWNIRIVQKEKADATKELIELVDELLMEIFDAKCHGAEINVQPIIDKFETLLAKIK